MRALVTGGSGFLGSHLGDALAEAGYEVRSLDVRPPPREAVRDREFLLADVRDADAVRRAVRGCDVVVDNAALVPVTRASAQEFRSVNLEGCRATLDAAAAEDAYVLHISSSSIYGVPEQLPVTTTTPLAPFEPYGESKAAAERLVQARRAAGTVVASLRSRALMGAGRLGIFEVIFSRIRAGKRVPLFGSGDRRIQMCAAEDFCSAAVAAIEQRSNSDFDIGAAEFGTLAEDLQSLIDHTGSSARLMPIPTLAIRAVLQPLHAMGRSPFTEWHWRAPLIEYYADISPAERELGWRPRWSNVDALERAYENYLRGRGSDAPSPHAGPLKGALARLLRG